MSIPVSDINKTRILRNIWLHPGISRIELAASLGLNKSSISKIIQERLDSESILTGDEGVPGPQGGRKPVGLHLNPGWGIFGGVEITESCFRLSALDFSGSQLFSLEKKHEAGEALNLPKILTETAELLIKKAEKKPILGLGVGIPGMVDCRTGTILRSEPLKIQTPLPFAAQTAGIFPFPIYMENDANCCCWGELAAQVITEKRSFLYILGEDRNSAPPGIGMGLALDGRVYHGPGYGAGEFKSILGQPSSSSQFSIPERKLSGRITDPELRKKTMKELGKNIALISNVLNLNNVILGGFFQSYEQEYFELIENMIHQYHSYPDTLGKLVSPSLFGSQAVSLGAAYMCVEHYMDLSGRFTTKLISKES